MPDAAPRRAWVRFHCSAGDSPTDSPVDSPMDSPGDSPTDSPAGSGRPALVAEFRRVGAEWQLAAVADDAPGAPAVTGALPLSGPFGIDPGYRGCPRCGADSYVRCGACGGLSCWRSTDRMSTCGACGRRAPVSGRIESLGALDAG